jgi:predicted RNA-binding Zn-ribbon protein involved in translation (DUF1610 family)
MRARMMLTRSETFATNQAALKGRVMSSCPKCGAPMEEGFIVDAFDRVQRVVSTWVEGAPEKSLWNGVRLRGKRRIGTKTFRCTKCGYLESYARS